MDKFINLEDDKSSEIRSHIESKSSELGIDAWETHQGGNLLKDQIGLCATCKNLQYCKTEFNNINAVCKEFECKLSGSNKIVDCNVFSPKGMLSLNDMFDIAIIIDLPKRKSGFIR